MLFLGNLGASKFSIARLQLQEDEQIMQIEQVDANLFNLFIRYKFLKKFHIS